MARKLLKKEVLRREKLQKAYKALKLAQRTLKEEAAEFRLHVPDMDRIESRACHDLDVPDSTNTDFSTDWHDLADNAEDLASDLRDLGNMARTVAEAIDTVIECGVRVSKWEEQA